MKTIEARKTSIVSAALASLAASAFTLALLPASSRADTNVIEAPLVSETVPSNFPASFFVAHNSTPPFGIEWYFNNKLITGATNSTLTIVNSQGSNVGTYTVIVTNSAGAATTNAAFLTLTNIQVQAPSLQFTTLNSFSLGISGASPQAGVIQAADGYLYGATLTGGANDLALGGDGTVFKMSTNGTFAWSFSFGYTNGAAPAAGLVQAGDGNLYGATTTGGQSGFGTIFRITPGGALTTIYNFTGKADGGDPEATLCLGSDGYLYGSTSTNETGSLGGTVFKMDTNGAFTWNVPLTTNIGTVPLGGLVQGAGGNLYGTASEGGTNGGYGAVFMLTTNGVPANLYSFTGGTDGGTPFGGLVQGTDGQLYGTTSAGGDLTLNSGFGDGTLFKVTTNGVLTTLVAFEGTNGASPEGSLFMAADGNYYGTANAGGAADLASLGNTLFPCSYGTIFQWNTNGTLSTLLTFNGNYDGNSPHCALVQGRDGGLYGTTTEGGAYDYGVGASGDGSVFRLSVAPPRIGSAARTGSTFSFTWNALVGEAYQPQYKDSLTQPAWLNLGGQVYGTNGTARQSDTIGATNLHRYYRVALPY